jgi:Ca2+-binding EF-hand superfamily protein
MLTHSLTYSLTYSLTHLLTYLLTYLITRYDIDLSGNIPAYDLVGLLQDIPGLASDDSAYTCDEVDAILSVLDADNLEIIDFEGFIRWWTT